MAGGGGRGGRRSDLALKHDITLLGRLDNGLGFYRFSYNGSEQAYVGVMAQEVQTILPEAVVRGWDGYLEVLYDKLGLKFQTYERWVASVIQLERNRPVAAGNLDQIAETAGGHQRSLRAIALQERIDYMSGAMLDQ